MLLKKSVIVAKQLFLKKFFFILSHASSCAHVNLFISYINYPKTVGDSRIFCSLILAVLKIEVFHCK